MWFKKLIMYWICKGHLNVRLPSRKAKQISNALLQLKPFITSDFSRKPRDIESIPRWKATEMRQFLLYTGPLVIKNILFDECSTNFQSLSLAMIILLSPDKKHLVKFAEKLLKYFIESFQFIYGKQFVSYNIHGILHLVEDYHNFGPLDNCSAFYFENYMKIIKNMVRKHEKPLEQVVKRYNQICLNKSNDFMPKHGLKKQHSMGPLVLNTIDRQYKIVFMDNFTIKITNNFDCYILTYNNSVIKVLNIAHLKNEDTTDTVVIGTPFLTKKYMFEKPIKSSNLDIYVVENLSMSLQVIKISEIKKKMMLFPLNGISFMSLPLLHSDPLTNSL